MLIVLIAVGIVIAIFVFGALLAFAVSRFDQAVAQSKLEAEKASRQQKGAYNPALTLGFELKPEADKEAQVKEARLLAARLAAAQPRGANMGIGRLGEAKPLRTAYKAVKEDPWTAAKIATVHGWDAVRLGPGAAAPAAAAPVAARPAAAQPAAKAAPAPVAAPAASGEIALVPGKDYPYIEITDSMSPEEKRKALIANSKAKSQALKAAKAAGAVPAAAAPAAAQVAAPAAAAVAAPAASGAASATAAAVAAGIAAPNYIEITPGMSPEEVRKARIHNAKEKSKYHKALKAAGIEPGEDGETATAVAAPTAPVVPEPEPAPAAAPAAGANAAALAGIPQPAYIEITDGMSPEEVRRARIQNAKERSKYHKALKAAGIDPATIEE